MAPCCPAPSRLTPAEVFTPVGRAVNRSTTRPFRSSTVKDASLKAAGAAVNSGAVKDVGGSGETKAARAAAGSGGTSESGQE
eukprot:scaffold13395_cov67-Isochrysis_galbana.AAC.2